MCGIGDWRMANLSGILPQVQITLVVYWIVFGLSRLPVRMAGIVLLFAIDQAWLASSRQYVYFYANLTTAVGAGVLAMSLVCWLAGWRLHDGRVALSAEDTPRPLQFSIRFLLVATTVVALATLAATSVYRQSEVAGTPSMPLRNSVLATGYTLSFSLTAWCVMQPGRWLGRYAVTLVAVPAIGALIYFLLRQTSGILAGSQWFAVSSALLGLSLAPARLLGYRLFRTPDSEFTTRPVVTSMPESERSNSSFDMSLKTAPMPGRYPDMMDCRRGRLRGRCAGGPSSPSDTECPLPSLPPLRDRPAFVAMPHWSWPWPRFWRRWWCCESPSVGI